MIRGSEFRENGKYIDKDTIKTDYIKFSVAQGAIFGNAIK